MFKTIDFSIYRRIFFNGFVPVCVMIALSLGLVMTGFYFGNGVIRSLFWYNVVFYGFIALAVVYTIYISRQKTKFYSFTEFEDRLTFFAKYYTSRVVWNVISAAVTCFLFVYLRSYFFLAYAVWDLAMLLILFPNKKFFQKQFGDEDLAFE